MAAMHCYISSISILYNSSSALTGKCVKGRSEELQKHFLVWAIYDNENDFLVWEICCITEQKVIPNTARGSGVIKYDQRCQNQNMVSGCDFFTGLAKYGSFDNLLFTRVTKCVKGERNGRTAETFVWKMCCIILWNVISERLNLFHINHKIFDRHLCCKGFSVCWKYDFRKWFLGMFYSTNTDMRIPSIWDFDIPVL